MYYKQLDYLKAFCIISVIFLHTLSSNVLYNSFSVYHIWNAVPVFILLMAFTTSLHFSKKDLLISNIYTKSYFLKKFKRIILPLIPVFIITLLLGIIFKKSMNLGVKNLTGMMPLVGPGNYYITIIFQFIILSPFLYYLYNKYPKISLIVSLFVNVIFELIIKSIMPNGGYLYSGSILRYLFLIYLGFCLYNLIKDNKKLSSWFYVGFIVSIIYLNFVNNPITCINIFLPQWKTQLFISSFYPFLLAFIGFKYLKFNSTIITNIGKGSYHIFLVQMVYFLVNPVAKITSNTIIQIIGNLIICIAIGYIFFTLNSKLIKRRI